MILVLRIFVCCSFFFANLRILSNFDKFCFFFTLSCQQDHGRAAAKHTIGARQRRLWHRRVGGQPFTHLNPPTSDLFFLPSNTPAPLPPNHTLSPHNRTLPPSTHDLTPDPAVDMGGAVHAQTSHTWKKAKHALGCHRGGGFKHQSRFEPGYLRVSPVLRLHTCSFRLYSAR